MHPLEKPNLVRPISPPWQASSAVSGCRAKKSRCVTKKREAIAIGTHHSNTRNHGCHRRPCRYPRAPRHRAQGARRAHPPRLHLQRSQGRAAQGTRGPSDPLSRKNTASRRVRYFSSSHLASARASRATVALAGRNPACGACGWHARYPFVAFPFGRSCFAPRGTHDRPGSGPVAFRRRRSFPRRLPWRSWKHRRAAFFFFLTFCRTRKREFVKSRRRRAPRDASRRRLTLTDCHDCRDD